MPQHYDETFKKQIVRLRLEEGQSIRSIIEEYGMSSSKEEAELPERHSTQGF